MGDDLRRIEEQCALSIAQEAMWPAEGIFFRNPRDGEGLTGKASEQHIMLRDAIRCFGIFPDITAKRMVVRNHAARFELQLILRSQAGDVGERCTPGGAGCRRA